jgi:hypothetical protein
MLYHMEIIDIYINNTPPTITCVDEVFPGHFYIYIQRSNFFAQQAASPVDWKIMYEKINQTSSGGALQYYMGIGNMRKVAKTLPLGETVMLARSPALGPTKAYKKNQYSPGCVPLVFFLPPAIANAEFTSVLCRAARQYPVLRARAVQLCTVMPQWKQRRMQPWVTP